MKKYYKKLYSKGEYEYTGYRRVVYYYKNRELQKTERRDSWWRPIWEYVDVVEKRVYNTKRSWGRWIEDETSDWCYYLDYRYKYSWWQQECRDAADKQDRREDGIYYKIKRRPYDMDPWDEYVRDGRGRVYGFKSWKHATKHRKQWMKNL